VLEIEHGILAVLAAQFAALLTVDQNLEFQHQLQQLAVPLRKPTHVDDVLGASEFLEAVRLREQHNHGDARRSDVLLVPQNSGGARPTDPRRTDPTRKLTAPKRQAAWATLHAESGVRPV
jgi:hypothetical protein